LEHLPTAVNIGGEETTLANLANIIGDLCQKTPQISIGNGHPVRRIMATELAQQVLAFQPEPLQDWLTREVNLYRDASSVS
jgi:hypothetical protein